jgi:hypothetical protein
MTSVEDMLQKNPNKTVHWRLPSEGMKLLYLDSSIHLGITGSKICDWTRYCAFADARAVNRELLFDDPAAKPLLPRNDHIESKCSLPPFDKIPHVVPR